MAEALLVDAEMKLLWEDRCNVFAWGFEQLFSEGLQFDVTLQIGDQQLQAHRHILSFCSKFFAHEFEQWPFEKRILVLEDVTYEAMQSILDYIYKGEVKVKKDAVPAFFGATTALQIEALQGLPALDLTDMEFEYSARGNIFVIGFELMFNASQHFDVTLTTEEGKSIEAHRNVLSVCSPYFRDILSIQEVQNKEVEVPLKNVEYSSLQSLMHYMYHGETIFDDLAMLSSVLNAGELFKVKGLEQAEDLDFDYQNIHTMRIYAHSKIEYDHRKYDRFDETKVIKCSTEPSQSTFSSECESAAQHRTQPKNKKKSKNGRPMNIPSSKLKKARKSAKPTRATKTYVEKPNKRESIWTEEDLENAVECNNNTVEKSANVIVECDNANTVALTQEEEEFYEMAGFDEQTKDENDAYDEDNDVANGQEYEEVVGHEVEAEDYEGYKDADQVGAGYMGYTHDDDTTYFDASQENELEWQYTASGYVNENGLESEAYDIEAIEPHNGSASKGRSKSTIRPKDRDFNIVASFIKGRCGGKQLVHNGFHYSISCRNRYTIRWQCLYSKCRISPYTKDVDGVEMAWFPHNSEHKHGPME